MTGTYSLIFKQIRLDSYVKLTPKNSSLPLMKDEIDPKKLLPAPNERNRFKVYYDRFKQ